MPLRRGTFPNMLVRVHQAFAFARSVEVLRPGVYRVDRLTVSAIRASAHGLVREGLICFEDDRDIVAPIVPAQNLTDEVQAEFEWEGVAEDFTDFADDVHARFDLDPVQLEDMA